MPLPFDLNSFDTVWQGQPCVANTSTGSIDLASLDYCSGGCPFIANNGPLDQSITLTTTTGVVVGGEVDVSLDGGDLSITLESASAIIEIGTPTVTTVTAITITAVDGITYTDALTISTTVNLSLGSVDGYYQSDALILTPGDVNVDVGSAEGVVIGGEVGVTSVVALQLDGADGVADMGAVTITTSNSIDLASVDSVVVMESVTVSAVVSLSLSELSTIVDAPAIAIGLPASSISLSSVSGIIAIDPPTLIPTVSLSLGSVDGVMSAEALVITTTTSISLDPTVGVMEGGGVSVTPGAVTVGLEPTYGFSSAGSLLVYITFYSVPVVTWTRYDTITAVFTVDGISGGTTWIPNTVTVDIPITVNQVLAEMGGIDSITAIINVL